MTHFEDIILSGSTKYWGISHPRSFLNAINKIKVGRRDITNHMDEYMDLTKKVRQATLC